MTTLEQDNVARLRIFCRTIEVYKTIEYDKWLIDASILLLRKLKKLKLILNLEWRRVYFSRNGRTRFTYIWGVDDKGNNIVVEYAVGDKIFVYSKFLKIEMCQALNMNKTQLRKFLRVRS